VAVGGCAVLAPSDGTGGPAVAGHLDYVASYLEAGEGKRERMIRELEDLPESDKAESRLRYAIVLSLRHDQAGRLVQSLNLLEELQTTEDLTPAERWLARLWHGEVSSRLDLTRENDDIRMALEQAEQKLEQLTRIEEQLEAQDNDSGEQ
jgi:hypothetical protein